MTEVVNDLRLLSKTASAKSLGIGKATLNKIIESGKLKVVVIDGRVKISMKELNRFLEDNTYQLSDLKQNYSVNHQVEKNIRSPTTNSKLRTLKVDNIFNQLKKEVHDGISI